ncbi:MAG: hypothetical protein ACK4QW_15600, partial [Alphaproteobacteria bacterium]
MSTDHIRIGDVAPRIQYAADGVQTVFVYPFPIFRPADIEVWVDAQRRTAGYAVIGAGSDEGGAVAFDTAPPAGARVTLLRRLVIARTTDFQEGGAFRARTLNDELDYQTAALQQLDAEGGRTLRLAPSDPDADPPCRRGGAPPHGCSASTRTARRRHSIWPRHRTAPTAGSSPRPGPSRPGRSPHGSPTGSTSWTSARGATAPATT